MALDEALAGDGAAPPAPALRLYRWRPWTLSLGWFQRVREEDLSPFLRAGHQVTRRPTGGGAIFHADEATYALVLPADDPRIPPDTAASYARFHGAVIEALRAVGVEASARGGVAEAGPDPFFCFQRATPLDLVARGRKLVGSAQRRTRTAFLQHGSIPLSPGGTAPAATSLLEERGGSPADPGAIEEALAASFARVLGAAAVPSAPAPEEEARAARLEEAKYGNMGWVLRPWRSRGRETAGSPTPRPPLRVLGARVLPEGLAVDSSAGGGHPLLPHARLAGYEVGRVRRREERAVPEARDPWDSTFPRSAFPPGPGGPEPPSHRRVLEEEEDTLLAMAYRDPAEAVRIDARRFNYAGLGSARTGRWPEDLRLLLGALAAAAPVATPGPGVRAALEGREPPLHADAAALHRAAAAAAGSGSV